MDEHIADFRFSPVIQPKGHANCLLVLPTAAENDELQYARQKSRGPSDELLDLRERDVGMITIVQSGLELVTQGLLASVGIELKIHAPPQLFVAGSAFLQHVAQYVQRSSCKLAPGERIDWGSSLLVLREAGPETMTVDELAFDGTSVLRGIDQALDIWTSQMELCRTQRASYTSTRYGSMVAVSPGLLDWAGPVEGIRYAAEGTMSGWWLFSPEYDGTADDFRSMQPTHVFHVLSKRSDLARYFALPEGYAFETGSGAVWLEREI